MFKNILIIPVAIVVAGAIIAGAIIYTNQNKTTPTTPSTPSASDQTQTLPDNSQTYDKATLENLAKCLTEKGFKFFGASWCGWCQKQKEAFGEAASALPYIECIDEKTQELTAECQKEGIEGFPTWKIPDGTKNTGFKQPEQLSQLSGCQI